MTNTLACRASNGLLHFFNSVVDLHMRSEIVSPDLNVIITSNNYHLFCPSS